MNYLLKRSLSILLTAVLLIGAMPYNTFAADDDLVLDKVTYAGTEVSLSATNITITVPWSTSNDATFNLTSNLICTIDPNYTSVGAFDWGTGSDAATIGNNYTLTIPFYRPLDVSESHTTYDISIAKALYVAPACSGTLSKTAQANTDLNFTQANFTGLYDQNDGAALAAVAITPIGTELGSLYLPSGTAYIPGNKISLAAMTSLIYRASATGAANYKVVAYDSLDAEASPVSGEATLAITVEPEVFVAANVSYTTTQDTPKKFTASDFRSVCQTETGEALVSVKFELPVASSGILYQNYVSSSNTGTAVTTATISETDLSNVTFVPHTGYTGTVNIDYTGTTASKTFTGKVVVTVNAITVAAVSYTTDMNTAFKLVSADFNTVCTNVTGKSLSYVKFTLPATTDGRLYYNYTSSSVYDSRVDATTKYYKTSSVTDLDNVTYVPYTGDTGVVTINYTGYDTSDTSYNGTIKITINSTATTTTYTTDLNTPVKFASSDINTVCVGVTGVALSYVKFTLPSTTYGKLYYNYTSSSVYDSRVDATTKYYKSSSTADLDNVSFVPTTSYTGTATISYTGYDTDGTSYTGKINVTVGSGTNTTTYTTDQNTPIKIKSTDINTVSLAATGVALSYVKFTLPSTTYGKLYYNYTSASVYDAKVDATTKYYKSSSTADLDNVSFVPTTDYIGTVTITYTGYDTDGTSYTGKIKITVGSVGNITYTTTQDIPVLFKSSDFTTACSNATGGTLSYVTFTLPSSIVGKLYYDYTSASIYGAKVDATTKYYKTSSTADLDYITFVPYLGYVGTASISYKGYDTDGVSFTGTVKVTVSALANTASLYFTDVTANYSWAVAAIDYLYKGSVVNGTSTGIYSPAAKITRGDFILMLTRALKLTSSATGTNFSDVPRTSYYYNAVAVAKALGIAQGSDGYFNPTAAITREDAMVLVYRALKISGTSMPVGTIANLSAYNDKYSVSDYAIISVGSLVSTGLVKGDGNYLNPKNSVTRAEMAVILYRVLLK